MASLMVSRGILSGGSVVVDVKNGEFAFEVKKGRGRVKTPLAPSELSVAKAE